MLAIESAFPQFVDVDGTPINNGQLFFGVVNLNPETNPITVYWDAAGTQPASQPIQTINGYAVRNGTPASIFVNSDYSLNVRNGRGNLVFYATTSKNPVIDGTVPTVANSAKTVDAITAVDATGMTDGIVIIAKGRSASGDGGGGIFRYVAGSVQTADGGTVFAPSVGSGRFFRDGWTVLGFDGPVNVLWFGAKGDNVADDKASIQSAMDATTAKIIELPGLNFRLVTGLQIPSGKKLIGQGKSNTTITCAANITPFTMLNANDASLEGVLIVAHSTQTAPLILLDANGVTMARCRVLNVQGSGSATDFPFISVVSRGGAIGNWAHLFSDLSVSGCGTIIKCETQAANSWINSLNVSHVYANDFIRGAHLIATAGDGCADSTFFDWAAQTSARTQFGALIADVSAQGISRKNSFTDVRFYDLIATALAYYIGSNVLDTTIQGLAVDDLIPSRIRDTGIGTRIQGMTVPEYMTRSGRIVGLQTNAGLTAAVSGTATTQSLVPYAQLRTGATAGSVARLYSTDTVSGLSQNQIFNTDFGKPLVMTFSLTRITTGASALGRVQFKTVQTDGALAAAGIGLQISNYDIFGESYGSSVATVNLGVTMADAQTYRIDIVHYTGVRVEWWVNGVLKGIQTTAANIPSGSAACYLHTSLSNIAANDVQMFFNAIELRAPN